MKSPRPARADPLALRDSRVRSEVGTTVSSVPSELARREPTMSMRLVYPFVAAARRRGVDSRTLRFLDHADPDSRLPARTAIELLRTAVRLTQDPELGLLAAVETTAGDYGGFEYAAGSSQTVGEALEFLTRNYFLIDEASILRYRVAGGWVRVSVLQPDALVCRAGVDFTLAMLYLAYLRWVGSEPGEYDVWLPYPKPEDLSAYHSLFGPTAALHFGANECGVGFRERDLALPLKMSDANLHGLLARYVERRYASERADACFVDTVRKRILEGLAEGQVGVARVASLMGVSRRTLARRLDREGTNFRQLLYDVRCACAVRYLLLETMSVEEVSSRLGYSEPAAFHRAFRSWFGESPSVFRARQRSRERAPEGSVGPGSPPHGSVAIPALGPPQRPERGDCARD